MNIQSVALALIKNPTAMFKRTTLEGVRTIYSSAHPNRPLLIGTEDDTCGYPRARDILAEDWEEAR